MDEHASGGGLGPGAVEHVEEQFFATVELAVGQHQIAYRGDQGLALAAAGAGQEVVDDRPRFVRADRVGQVRLQPGHLLGAEVELAKVRLEVVQLVVRDLAVGPRRGDQHAQEIEHLVVGHVGAVLTRGRRASARFVAPAQVVDNPAVATALVIGGSDGIGLALTRTLVAAGWRVGGVSRSDSPVPEVEHVVADVRATDYGQQLTALCDRLKTIDACIYCAGVGQPLQPDQLAMERATFDVNLIGAVATAEVVLPRMLAAGHGHFVGLSSLANRFISRDAPAYSGSKAGLSSWLEGLALAYRPRGVYVTNVRFGFVDTKMARSEVKPFVVSAERAAARVMRCLRTRPIRCTYPRRMAALMWLVGWGPRLRVWWS